MCSLHGKIVSENSYFAFKVKFKEHTNILHLMHFSSGPEQQGLKARPLCRCTRHQNWWRKYNDKKCFPYGIYMTRYFLFCVSPFVVSRSYAAKWLKERPSSCAVQTALWLCCSCDEWCFSHHHRPQRGEGFCAQSLYVSITVKFFFLTINCS